MKGRRIMKKFTTRRLAGALAATTLSLGLVACAGENEENVQTSEVESTVEETVPAEEADPTEVEEGESTVEETNAPADAADSTEEAAEGDAANSVSLTLADGSTVLVTEDFASELENVPEEFGKPVQVTEGDQAAMAEFESGDLLVTSEEHGTNQVVGEIARVWRDGGGLENSIGLPTGEEEETDEGNGWIQQFANGTISWTDDGSGTFSETVTPGGES
ncbi:LGFP repeat protein [Corynebacterium guangdongense]|nr:LGFP repeat protein [Corynebacterium guangdongense]